MLSCFSYELIEKQLITKYSKGKIIILSEKDKIEELVKYLMLIMNLYKNNFQHV